MSWNPTLLRYQRNFSGVASAPASVTVTSSGGGSITQPVPYPPVVWRDPISCLWIDTTQTLTVLAPLLGTTQCNADGR